MLLGHDLMRRPHFEQLKICPLGEENQSLIIGSLVRGLNFKATSEVSNPWRRRGRRQRSLKLSRNQPTSHPPPPAFVFRRGHSLHNDKVGRAPRWTGQIQAGRGGRLMELGVQRTSGHSLPPPRSTGLWAICTPLRRKAADRSMAGRNPI
jgi:hypothetical protein